MRSLATPPPVVFFDLNTLIVRVCPPNPDGPVVELAAGRAMVQVLKALSRDRIRLGITSTLPTVSANAIHDGLRRAGLSTYFEHALIVLGSKESPVWSAAADRVGAPESESTLLFVNASASERREAWDERFLIAPHPLLAQSVLSDDGPLRYLRIRIPYATSSSRCLRAVSPLEEGETTRPTRLRHALLSTLALRVFHAVLAGLGRDTWVPAPRGDGEEAWWPQLRSLPLVPTRLAAEAGARGTDTVYAIADTSTAAKLDDLGFWVDRLGDLDLPQTTNLYLIQDDRQKASGFLNPAGNSARLFSRRRSARSLLASIPGGLLMALAPGDSPEDYDFLGGRDGHIVRLSPSTAPLEPRVARTDLQLALHFAAARGALDGPGFDTVLKILKHRVSRKAIDEVVERYSAATVKVCGGNVIRSRHAKHPHNSHAVCALQEDLERIGGGRLTVCTLPFTFESGTRDNVEARLPARGAARAGEEEKGYVLIGAHLDSTASCLNGYDPANGNAPGANDNASGIAGVLCAASAILELDRELKMPRREIRFVLFNAEEVGKEGSEDYAKKHAEARMSATAVFIMDMIGRMPSPPIFQLHTGHSTGPPVHGPSKMLANLVAEAARKVSKGLVGCESFHDADDSASGRSDHSPFRELKLAACLASQSPFPSSCRQDSPYHNAIDVKVDGEYAADITRAVAAAAWAVAIT